MELARDTGREELVQNFDTNISSWLSPGASTEDTLNFLLKLLTVPDGIRQKSLASPEFRGEKTNERINQSINQTEQNNCIKKGNQSINQPEQNRTIE